MTTSQQEAVPRPSLDVTPSRALIDTPLAIQVTGLIPDQPITLRATLTGDPGNGVWQAAATYVADASGCVDVQRMAPQAGSYHGVDGMGLLWSMLPAAPTGAESAFRTVSWQPLTLTVTAELDERPVAATMVTRLLGADDLTVTEVREEGLVGRLFAPPGPGPHPGVIVLSGSGGGLWEDQAAFIASHGFAALALAYFNYADLPPLCVDIPLEYFEAAVRWLSARPAVKPTGVGVVGTSRGGELALLLGATFPTIHAVVALVPGHVRWVPWQYRGQVLPFMTQAAGTAAVRQRPPEEQTGPIAVTPTFLAALDDAAAEAAAAIAVERINGPVLLISGTDDAMWPSTLMAERALARLREHDHPYRDEHLAYTGAGHTTAFLPGLPAAPLPGRHPVAGLVLAVGGTAARVAAARQDAWPRILQCLRESL